MVALRLIPCLDVSNGRVVKVVNFVGLRDAGDPVELGCRYSKAGADELVFLDITATHEKRSTLVEMVRRTSEAVTIHFNYHTNATSTISHLVIDYSTSWIC